MWWVRELWEGILRDRSARENGERWRGETYWHACSKGLGIEDMVRLVFGGFAIECGEELFRELKFRHVGFCQALLF